MSVPILLEHEEHGLMNVYTNTEVKANAREGWTVVTPNPNIVKPKKVEPVEPVEKEAIFKPRKNPFSKGK